MLVLHVFGLWEWTGVHGLMGQTQTAGHQLMIMTMDSFSLSVPRFQPDLYRPGRLHPALQLQAHWYGGDPLVQAADPGPQLLLQQGPVWSPEQTLQWKNLSVQLTHPSRKRLPAPPQGEGPGQGQVQVLHQHTEGQPGGLHQPGGQRSVTSACLVMYVI